MRVYHFIDSKFGLQNIKNRHLKVSTLDTLNDPFELLGVATRDVTLRRKYRELKDGISQYSGILCFSKNRSNPVQWSHYADRHRGLCLGFDISSDLFPVVYSKKRLAPDATALAMGGHLAESHMQTILTTKFEHWSYEEEYRLFVHLTDKDEDTGLYFFGFDNRVRLREVIVGPLSLTTRAEVAGAIGDLRGVQISKARLAFRTFKVVRQKRAELWK